MGRSQQQSRINLVVDSTGLKIFGEGEWLERKHKTKGKRRSWRKLHLGLDHVSGEIVCSDLTKDGTVALIEHFGQFLAFEVRPVTQNSV